MSATCDEGQIAQIVTRPLSNAQAGSFSASSSTQASGQRESKQPAEHTEPDNLSSPAVHPGAAYFVCKLDKKAQLFDRVTYLKRLKSAKLWLQHLEALLVGEKRKLKALHIAFATPETHAESEPEELDHICEGVRAVDDSLQGAMPLGIKQFSAGQEVVELINRGATAEEFNAWMQKQNEAAIATETAKSVGSELA